MLYFSTFTISAAALWIVVLGLKFYVIAKRKRLLKGQLSGLRLSSELKKLLVNIQQHRGRVVTFSRGDASFRPKILGAQRAVNDTIGSLVQLSAGNPDAARALNEIIGEWKRLEQAVWGLSTENGFVEHSRLIDKILNVIGTVAEQNQLRSYRGCSAEYVNITWRLVPAMAEALGRARAVGSGIAATGRAKALDRIRLGFLIQKIKASVQQVEKRIQKEGGHDSALKTVHLHPAGTEPVSRTDGDPAVFCRGARGWGRRIFRSGDPHDQFGLHAV